MIHRCSLILTFTVSLFYTSVAMYEPLNMRGSCSTMFAVYEPLNMRGSCSTMFAIYEPLTL